MNSIKLCPHQMNQVSCPTCFRMKPPEAKKAAPVPGVHPGIPMGNVMPIGEATLRATSRAAAAPPPAPANGPVLKEPHRSSTGVAPPESYDAKKLWQPPQHRQIIDRQPHHPHADQGTAKVLKA